MIDRTTPRTRIESALERYPVVAMLGPRQCGKSTLAREVGKLRSETFFDLEDPACPLLTDSARFVLEPLRGLVVLDEIQHRPDLFPLLRVLADRPDIPARFLLLGSASPHLVAHVSETLAGRVATIPMSGFDLTEIGADNFRSLWLRGGFPLSWLAGTDAESMEWRNNFIRTFLERDIPALGIRVQALPGHPRFHLRAPGPSPLVREPGQAVGEVATGVLPRQRTSACVLPDRIGAGTVFTSTRESFVGRLCH